MPTINWSFENDDDPAGSLMNSNSTTFFLAEHMEAKWYNTSFRWQATKEKFRVRAGITSRAFTSMVELNSGTHTISVRLSQTSQKDRTLTGNLGPDSPLNHLPYAVDAPFDSYQRQHEPTCLENTRVDVLRQIFDWADGQDERCIFWLNGLAGTGKSTIARTVALEYFERKRLRASFFFSRGSGDVSYASKFFTSIAIRLANNVLPL